MCFNMQETMTLLLANNKGTDHPAHRHGLISTFVIHYLKSKVTRSGDKFSTSPLVITSEF